MAPAAVVIGEGMVGAVHEYRVGLGGGGMGRDGGGRGRSDGVDEPDGRASSCF